MTPAIPAAAVEASGARPAVAAPRAAVVVVAAGCAALTARPLLLAAAGSPAPVLTVLFLSLLAVSVGDELGVLLKSPRQLFGPSQASVRT